MFGSNSPTRRPRPWKWIRKMFRRFKHSAFHDNRFQKSHANTALWSAEWQSIDTDPVELTPQQSPITKQRDSRVGAEQRREPKSSFPRLEHRRERRRPAEDLRRYQPLPSEGQKRSQPLPSEESKRYQQLHCEDMNQLLLSTAADKSTPLNSIKLKVTPQMSTDSSPSVSFRGVNDEADRLPEALASHDGHYPSCDQSDKVLGSDPFTSRQKEDNVILIFNPQNQTIMLHPDSIDIHQADINVIKGCLTHSTNVTGCDEGNMIGRITELVIKQAPVSDVSYSHGAVCDGRRRHTDEICSQTTIEETSSTLITPTSQNIQSLSEFDGNSLMKEKNYCDDQNFYEDFENVRNHIQAEVDRHENRKRIRRKKRKWFEKKLLQKFRQPRGYEKLQEEYDSDVLYSPKITPEKKFKAKKLFKRREMAMQNIADSFAELNFETILLKHRLAEKPDIWQPLNLRAQYAAI